MIRAYKFALAIAVFWSSVCLAQAAPPEGDIGLFLKRSFPFPDAVLEQFEILAAENVGDKVEPIVKSRVRTVWTFNEEYYYRKIERRSSYLNRDVYQAADLQGVKIEIYEIVLSKPKGPEWFHDKVRTEAVAAVNTDYPEFDLEWLIKYQRENKNFLLTRDELPDSALIFESDEYTTLLKESVEAEKRDIEKHDKNFDNKKYALTKGEAVYSSNCLACHQADGEGVPGAFPALAGSPIVRGNVDDLIDLVMNGRKGTAMVAFGENLSSVDIAAVITFLRNSWGNDTGDVVKPSIVAAHL